MRLLTCVICFFILAQSGIGQSLKADDLTFLQKQLKANSRSITYSNGTLSGDGAQFIFREATNAQFFLIGEEHGIAENPLFAAAVLRVLQRNGYKYFAAEIGRLTAAMLETAASRKPVIEVLAEFDRRYPFSLPFFNWKEEGILLETALAPPIRRVPRIWGLDQEFFFSPAYHFDRLRKLAANSKARDVVDEYYSKVRNELADSIKTKNPSKAFIVTATSQDFDKLEAVFGAKDAEAREIVRDLRESAEIYQKNFRGEQYENNLHRARHLKSRFMDYYNSALKTEKTPKVFFKFGAGHVFRGRNYVNVFDVGNLASEIAESNGLNSFHILVIATGGSQNKFLPFVGNEADKRRKLDAARVYPYFDPRPFYGLHEEQAWQIIDLRPIRPLLGSTKLGALPAGLTELIVGFDAVLLLPNASPTTFFE